MSPPPSQVLFVSLCSNKIPRNVVKMFCTSRGTSLFDAYKKIVLFVLPPDGDMKHYRSVEGADFCRQHTETQKTSPPVSLLFVSGGVI